MRNSRLLGLAAASATLVAVAAWAGVAPGPRVGRPLGIRGPQAPIVTARSAADSPEGFQVSSAVRHSRSAPLRRLEPVQAPPGWQPRIEEEAERLPGPERAAETGGSQAGSPDPVIQQRAPSARMPAAAVSFEGISQSQQESMGYWALPPDTSGDVGPDHYVQMVNTSVAVYDKTGTLLYGPAAISTLWNGAGGVCDSNDDGDPIVLYDELADRWLVSQFALPNYPNGPFYECVAVSATADPTGAWNRYEFKMSNTKLNDYPKFGVWPDGYYVSFNQFSGTDWAGGRVAVLQRDQMLAGNAADMITLDLFSVDQNLGGLLPADVDGAAPPPGAPALFAQMDDTGWGYPKDQLELWEFDTDWGTPANSTFTQLAESPVEVAAFDSDLCGYAMCVPQPGGAPLLDALSDRIMWRLQYRNFGTYETLVTSQTVDANGNDRAGVRWYELRDTGSGWAVNQQGTFSPDATHRFMPSAAMNADGAIAVGYSASSSSVEPAIRWAGRVATDPVGQLSQGEGVLQAGGGHQNSTSGRWGDYSAMSVDPSDGCTFWFTSEYYAGTSNRSFSTRIGALRFPGCGSAPGDTTPPANVTVAPFVSPVSTGPVDVSWSATDAESGVATYDVSLRQADWNGDFGSPSLWQDATAQTSATRPVAAGTTDCFSVRARDVAGNLSSASSERCVSFPVDDAGLVPTGVWSGRAGAGHYLGTFSLSKARGASLTATGLRADRIWILADRCRRCGDVVVVWNGSVIDKVRLQAKHAKKMASFQVASFGATQTGTLRIRVTSRGLPVRIDGVAYSRT